VEIHDVGSSSTTMDTDAPTSSERENGSTQASSSSSSSQSSYNFNQVKRVCLHNLYGFFPAVGNFCLILATAKK
jgi:hypothetical protein